MTDNAFKEEKIGGLESRSIWRKKRALILTEHNSERRHSMNDVIYQLTILLSCRRPGVLVLVNDCDWELSGQLDTTLEEKDVVVFISTLHGG